MRSCRGVNRFDHLDTSTAFPAVARGTPVGRDRRDEVLDDPRVRARVGHDRGEALAVVSAGVVGLTSRQVTERRSTPRSRSCSRVNVPSVPVISSRRWYPG